MFGWGPIQETSEMALNGFRIIINRRMRFFCLASAVGLHRPESGGDHSKMGIPGKSAKGRLERTHDRRAGEYGYRFYRERQWDEMARKPRRPVHVLMAGRADQVFGVWTPLGFGVFPA